MGHVDAAAASPLKGKSVEPHVAGITPRILDHGTVGKQGEFMEEDEEYYSSSVFSPTSRAKQIHWVDTKKILKVDPRQEKKSIFIYLFYVSDCDKISNLLYII
jgi:hypothetical protein